MVNMNVRELDKCSWENIDSRQTEKFMKCCDKYGMKGIYDELSAICKSISAVLNLPYAEVFKIIKEKNGLFYCTLYKFQHNFMLYGDVSELTVPLSYLTLPTINQRSGVEECLKAFYSLSEVEKGDVIKVLQSYIAS